MAEKQMGPASYLVFVKGNEIEQNLLKKMTAVEKTYFFRPQEHYELFAEELPKTIRRKGEALVWYPGCSSGEGPASLYIVAAARSTQTAEKTVIYASDLRKEAIDKAKAGGPYSSAYALLEKGDKAAEWISFAKKKGLFIENPRDDSFLLSSAVTSSIKYLTHDLTTNAILGAFDFIFCCNVLFYYKRVVQVPIVQKLFGALSRGGHLFLGDDDLKTISEALEGFKHERQSPTVIRRPL